MKNGHEIKIIIETIEKLEGMQTTLRDSKDTILRIHVDGQEWWIPKSACGTFAESLTTAIAKALESAKKRYRELSEESLR
jgi:hypothetical protein